MPLYSDRHTTYLRMDVSSLDHILTLVTPLIKKEDTIMWNALELGLKLAVTLLLL